MNPRRRRALLLLSLALASGGLAASQVSGTVGEVEQRVGRPVPVVVAARDLAARRPIRSGQLALRRVPARFVPPGAVSSVAEAGGLRPAVAVAAGSYLTEGQLEGATARGGGGLAPGERAVEVAVAGGEALSESGAAGGRVDVLVSTEGGSGRGRSFLALEDVELLSLRGGGETEAPQAAATPPSGGRHWRSPRFRVTLRQAVYLTAAENFAREVRLLPRRRATAATWAARRWARAASEHRLST